MSTRTLGLSVQLHDYLLRETILEPPVLRQLREETAKLESGRMQISPEQGQFMQLLCRMNGVRRAIEIGTFTGYSSTCVASALPPDGRLICCDVNEEWTSIARRYWKLAGVESRIELRLGPALETLDKMLAAESDSRGSHDGLLAGAFDFVFIDADKINSDQYYERALRLLRSGGLVAVDNAIWDGKVADLTINDADTVAHRNLNHKVARDPRVTASLVPIGDGLLLARKN